MAAIRPQQSPPGCVGRPTQITGRQSPPDRCNALLVSFRPTPASSSRIQLKVSQPFFLCKAKTSEFEVAPCHNSTIIPSCSSTAEREQVKAVLTSFLRKQGFSYAVATRIIKKSGCFVDHLLKLHSSHKSHYLGREPAILRIRGALIPYLESLLEEHRDTLIDFVMNFPDHPGTVSAASTSPANITKSSSKKERANAHVIQVGPDGLHSEVVLYLMDLGLDLEQINHIVRKFRNFVYCHLDRNVRPYVEFLLELGVKQSDIARILIRTRNCSLRISENLKLSMAYLENLGVDKSKRAKIITRCPHLLSISRQKIKRTVDYLYELGVSEKKVGRILTRNPYIVCLSIENNLRPTANYFRSVGIDVTSLMQSCPVSFSKSIEAKLKPMREFFLEKGFSEAKFSAMVNRFGQIYGLSIADNLLPKWNYFLTMDYPKSDLVSFPQYFGYSLEGRIKPRCSLAREFGIRLSLASVLVYTDRQFEAMLEKKKINCKSENKP